MHRAAASSVFVIAFVVACSGQTANTNGNTGTQSGALGTYRDGCDAATCGDRPAPKHSCTGGYPSSVCTKARGACGWQVDYLHDPPADFDGSIGVSPCSDCGTQPAFDDKDCVYGFIGEPQCEKYGTAACGWTRRCRPQPCDQTGTCNVLDRSKLGGACDIKTPCPTGYSCASIAVNIGENIPPTCVKPDSCPLTCAAGTSCAILDSFPGQIVCGR